MNISYIVYHTIKCCFVLGSTTVAIVTLSQTILLTTKISLNSLCPQDAIRSARLDAGVEPTAFQLDAPATAERIRMACEDDMTRRVPELPPPGSFTPWGIQV